MSWPAPGEGAILAPSGHPPVDQRRVLGQTRSRPDAEALGHPRPEALDQRVGAAHQPEARPSPSSCFRSTPIELLPRPSRSFFVEPVCPPVTASVRSTLTTSAQVGKDHPTERRRPQGGDLHNPHSLQGTRHLRRNLAAAGRQNSAFADNRLRALDQKKGAYSRSGVMVKAPSRMALAM